MCFQQFFSFILLITFGKLIYVEKMKKKVKSKNKRKKCEALFLVILLKSFIIIIIQFLFNIVLFLNDLTV